MKWILDTNVLFIAINTWHDQHAQTRAWLDAAKPTAPWGASAETYLGAIRLLMNPKVMKGAHLDAGDAVKVTRREFSGPNAGKIVTGDEPDDALLRKAKGHKQIMDIYQIQVAAKHGAKLVTMDDALRAAFPAIAVYPS